MLGALIGLAGLTRGEGLLLGLLLAVPWILGHRALSLATRWRQLLVSGAACLVVLAPWTIRNLTTFDVFVPISTNSNELIMYANCPDTYSGRLLGFWSFDCQVRYRAEHGEPPGDEADKAMFWRDVGVDYARDHAGEIPKVVAARVLRQWELFRPWQTIEFASIENRDKEWSTVGLCMYYALVAASIAGAVVLHRRRVRLLPLLAQVVSVTITAAYAYGTVRFRAPVEPVLCILGRVVGGGGVAAGARRGGARRRAGRGHLMRVRSARWATALAVAVLALLAYVPVAGVVAGQDAGRHQALPVPRPGPPDQRRPVDVRQPPVRRLGAAPDHRLPVAAGPVVLARRAASALPDWVAQRLWIGTLLPRRRHRRAVDGPPLRAEPRRRRRSPRRSSTS